MPRLNRNALSAAQIKRREMEPGVYADGAGLALKVDPLGKQAVDSEAYRRRDTEVDGPGELSRRIP